MKYWLILLLSLALLFGCQNSNSDTVNMQQTASAVFPADKYNELMQSATPLFIDFNAKWCGPCKLMKPMFEELALQYKGKVNFISIDTDKNPEIAAAYGVSSIPTFVLVESKVVQWGSEGSLSIDMLEAPLKKYK